MTRGKKGETYLGEPVGMWATQAETAELLDVSVRHLQQLDGRGIPSRGGRKAKRYPFPHAVVWHLAYSIRTKKGLVVDRLPFGVAAAELRANQLVQEAEESGALRVRSRRGRA